MIPQILKVLDEEFTVHRFNRITTIPVEVFNSDFYWIGKTDEELSIVCNSQMNLQSDNKEAGWKGIKIIGPFAFTEIGIVAEITRVLAESKIGVFVVSTFDTDYVLVKKENLECSIEALTISGYTFTE